MPGPAPSSYSGDAAAEFVAAVAEGGVAVAAVVVAVGVGVFVIVVVVAVVVFLAAHPPHEATEEFLVEVVGVGGGGVGDVVGVISSSADVRHGDGARDRLHHPAAAHVLRRANADADADAAPLGDVVVVVVGHAAAGLAPRDAGRLGLGVETHPHLFCGNNKHEDLSSERRIRRAFWHWRQNRWRLW